MGSEPAEHKWKEVMGYIGALVGIGGHDAQVRKMTSRIETIRDDYLSLMERCLTGAIYEDRPLKALGTEVYDPALREVGRDWPSLAHTMIGVKRLRNLRALTEEVIRKQVPGDLMETGVWRGGACIMMRAVLKAYRITDRRVWVADSFQGVPPPDAEKYPADRDSDYHTFPDLSVPADEVRRNIGKYGLLDDQIVFLEGWFRDTLPAAPIERLALLRLDGDLYESTIVALNALYEKLSVGGYVIVDDYHVVDGCRAAVSDFRAERGIRSLLSEIDGVGVFWQKTESG